MRLTRDQMRSAYAASGTSGKPITFERAQCLRDLINAEMLSDGLMDGTYHMRHPATIKVHDDGSAELRCQSHYFDNREAVTFNSDGFVGFAGWADESHVQPILRGFQNWIKRELAPSVKEGE